MLIIKRYFYVQRFTFAAIGIDITAGPQPEPQSLLPGRHSYKNRRIIKHPALLFIPYFVTFFQCLTITHYVYKNANDYREAIDSLTLLCQAIISVWKMVIFLYNRKEIVQLIMRIKVENLKAKGDELTVVRNENSKDILFSTIYLVFVSMTGFLNLFSPLSGVDFKNVSWNELNLPVPHKATYVLNPQHIDGYTIACMLNILTVYYMIFCSVAVDCLFSWLVCNVIAQFRILLLRFEMTPKAKATAKGATPTTITATESPSSTATTGCSDNDDTYIGADFDEDWLGDASMVQAIIDCIKFHNRTLQLTEELNRLYGALIFVKFTISCTQICCLAFCLSRSNQSLSFLAYLGLFLYAVALQLILYCYNGQRIHDVSSEVASQIYAVFQWSHLAKSTKKLLLMPMMRSQKFSQLRGVFFTVDLSLYLWVFKTAGSLIAVLKNLDENQD